MKYADIKLTDEFEDEDKNQESDAKLNLETGWITDVVRTKEQISHPHQEKDYEFSNAILTVGNKEIDFTVNLTSSGQYQVSREELSQIVSKIHDSVNNKKMKM